MAQTIARLLLLSSSLALLPAAVDAAGLGRLTVLSGLGQPLRAEIEIVSVQRGEAETLQARLAPVEAYQQASIEYTAALQALRFSVERRPDGRYVVSMTSPAPVNDPFLDVLVELSSNTGRLVREYTFLLDPQEYKGPQQARPQVTPPQATPAPAPTARRPETARPPTAPAAPAPSAGAPTTPSAPAAPAPAAAGPHRVVAGDTLANIARQYQSSGVTMQQMIVAIYRANADEFDGRNMNRIRAGRILNIPDSAAAAAVSPQEASGLIVSQAREWNAYKAQLARAVAVAPARADSAGQASEGRITARVDGGAETNEDRLRIAQAEGARPGSPAATATRQDDLAAREAALKEAQSRVADLEKNVRDLQRLLDLKNQELARLQQQAQAPSTTAQAPAVPAPAAAAKPESPAKPGASATPPASAPQVVATAPQPAKPEAAKPEAAKPESPKVEAPVPAAPPAVEATPKPAAPKPAAPVPVAESSLLDDVLGFVGDNALMLGGGAVGLLAVIGGLAAMRRRKGTQLEDSLIGPSQPDTSSVFGASGGRAVDTAGSSPLQTDFSQGGIGAIDTDEVDPVAEADVYMAYGRDAQAEEILKEALEKDPARNAVRLKLLEIYSARKDVKAFETTASELYATTDGQGPDWEKAASLGAQIDPGNPLYAKVGAAVAGAAAGTAAGFVAGAKMGSEGAPVPDIDLSMGTEGAGTPPLDINLDTTTTFSKSATAQDRGQSPGMEMPRDLGFDLNLGDHPSVAPPAEHGRQSAQGRDMSIDFELPGGKDSSGTPSSLIEFDLGSSETAHQKATSLDSISLDLGTPTDGAAASIDARWQEVATKLDLAKAYQEMGDRDGAKELLSEVIKEGDGAQQQQARKMLELIG